jgi:hypothetical protein
MAHPQVDRAHTIRAIQGQADVRIHPALLVKLGDPIELRLDPERLKRPEEDLAHEMARVAGRGTSGRSGHARQRNAHISLHRIGRQKGLRIHGVHVVDAIKEPSLDSGSEKGSVDGVVEHDAAQRTDVNRARGRLRVVDDLRPRGGSG